MFQTRLLANWVSPIPTQIIGITTAGDNQHIPLTGQGTSGLFVNTLRNALLDDRVDFIVHSLKDVPTVPDQRFALAAVPERVKAAASFHGGNMATDDPNSPHVLADRIKAKVLVAGADEDRSFDEAQKERLSAALEDAGVEAEVSIWKGCRHGWVPTDMPVHNPEGAERHWRELVALFDGALK